MTEQFHIGDLLTVTTDRLLSPSHVDGLYRIVDYVTGVPHFTHQLPRGADACKPHLLKQHPWLAEVTVPDWVDSQETVARFLAQVSASYGEYHDVEPLPFGAYVGREPLAEMEEMVGKDRVIPVVLPDNDSPGGPS